MKNILLQIILLGTFLLSTYAFSGVLIETGYFDQKLNHFTSVSEKFSQKYYVYSHPDATLSSPVFYMLGNENTISPAYLTGTIMKHLADTFKGHTVILEHRFYGDSIPRKNLEISNLVLLTTEQALNDFAYFQTEFTRERKLTGKWISVGSSYAGNLSAYYRLKYPHLVVGAIVSSAPLKTLRFNRLMDDQVVKELGTECLQSYQERIADIKINLQKIEYRKIFNQKTGSAKIADERSIYFTIADLLTIITQRGLSEKACAVLKTKPGLDGLIAALEIATGPRLNLYENSLEIAFDSNISINGKIANFRQWHYQTCTEYGFWQLPNQDESIRFRDSSVNKSYYKWFCKKTYGVKLSSRKNVPLKKYLYQIKNGTNLNMLLINGTRDPWARLSWDITDPERGIEVYNQSQGHHGTGIGGPRLNESPDSPSQLARNKMVLVSEKWIAE